MIKRSNIVVVVFFVTGKHEAAHNQVKQDKLKNPQVVESMEKNIQRQYFVPDRHTLGLIPTDPGQPDQLMRPAVTAELCTSGDNSSECNYLSSKK